jgi:RNA polymerase sigma factor (TIGR02999 family)
MESRLALESACGNQADSMGEEDDARSPASDLTAALRGLGAQGAGPRDAARDEARPEALREALAELRRVARSYLSGQRADHTLQPTALVNEAFLKLVGSDAVEAIRDRQHFFALAARAMRQVLVDHARQRAASKRGGGAGRVTFVDGARAQEATDDEVLDVDAALAELATLDERQARVVELRFFAGLEVEEVAAAMELSVSTVEREWRAAKAWLGRRMQGGRTP